LAELKLDRNQRLVYPFSQDMVEAKVHFADYVNLRGYIRCHGEGCLLCRLGASPDERDLWPVYDVIARRVVVLPISPSVRPNSLRAGLFPVLEQLATGKEMVLGLRRLEMQFFEVSVIEPAAGADLGHGAVCAFLDDYRAGKVDLASIYQAIPNEHLAR